MNCYIHLSEIHGRGWFALKDLDRGELLHPSEDSPKCMLNHSDTPNTERDGLYQPRAKRKIEIHEELTEDYRLLPWEDRPCICQGDEPCALGMGCLFPPGFDVYTHNEELHKKYKDAPFPIKLEIEPIYDEL